MEINSILEFRVLLAFKNYDEFVEKFNDFFEKHEIILEEEELKELLRLKKKIKTSDMDNKTKMSLSRRINFICERSFLFLGKRNIIDMIEKKKLNYREKRIKKGIKNERIILNNEYPEKALKKIVWPSYHELVEDKRIIRIDSDSVVTSEGAFSIEKKDDKYLLDVYIADSVTFLYYNPDIADIAYKRSKTVYIAEDDHLKRINMLPDDVATELSLNTNERRNVIQFTFLIDNEGNILNCDTKLSSIKVDFALSPRAVGSILSQTEDTSELHNDLTNLKDLSSILMKKHDTWKFSYTNWADIANMIGCTSSIVNYYVAVDSYSAIYRDKGRYTREYTEYTHSATPLRKIISDINLGLYLNQKGLLNVKEELICKIQNNIDEIIRHTNNKEEVFEFVSKYPEYVLTREK